MPATYLYLLTCGGEAEAYNGLLIWFLVHWQVLKKYNYNRPHLDQLTQILVKQLIPDCDLKLTQYRTNRTFPAWWQTFKRSEERRVGKECRSRWSTYHEKK